MSTSAIPESVPTIRPKEFHFPVAVDWIGGRRVAARVEGKPAIEIAPPPAFRGTDPELWSPEDFLVAAAGSCLAITFTGLAAREDVAYENLRVEADGVAGRRRDGRFGFTRICLHMSARGPDVGAIERLARKAEESCLVSASLDLPVELEVDVGYAPGERSSAATP